MVKRGFKPIFEWIFLPDKHTAVESTQLREGTIMHDMVSSQCEGWFYHDVIAYHPSMNGLMTVLQTSQDTNTLWKQHYL